MKYSDVKPDPIMTLIFLPQVMPKAAICSIHLKKLVILLFFIK